MTLQSLFTGKQTNFRTLMKSFVHLSAKLFNRPLLLHPPVLRNFGNVLARRITGGDLIIRDEDRIAQQRRPRTNAAAFAQCCSERAQCLCEQYANVAVIHICGAIDKALSDFEVECFDAVDLRDVDEALCAARDNPQINTIVLNFDTPGGSTVGVPETAARIRELAQTKEVHAYTDTLCCSAGMWLASACDVIAATPSATIGSIGVYIALMDASAAYEAEGLKVECISAGEFKTMGAEWKALADSERKLLQDNVNKTWADFRAAVTATREVPQSAMEGQWFDASEGHDNHIIDQLVPCCLEEYIAQLLSSPSH